jgi:hypothetical protein
MVRRILPFLTFTLFALLLLITSPPDASAASKKPSEAIKKNRCELKLVADYDVSGVEMCAGGKG